MDQTTRTGLYFKVEDWPVLRTSILLYNEKWSEAIKVFDDRIQSRFIEPIEKIKSINKNKGEGFSIALISVVLLEFLAAFELGLIYSYSRNGLSPSEFNSGNSLLKKFLRNSPVFSGHFESNSKIDKFYENIRCGLVHEARTLNDDIIISDRSTKNTQNNCVYFKEESQFRLNRDLLLIKIKEFIADYKSRLLNNVGNCRSRFILKMDEIHGLKHVWFFLYGEELNEVTLKRELLELNDKYFLKRRCSLRNYKFVYNRNCDAKGTCGCNIEKHPNAVVHGVSILILETTMDKMIQSKSGSEKVAIEIETEDHVQLKDRLNFKAFTYFSDDITSTDPSKIYIDSIVRGAKDCSLPIDYIKAVLDNE